MFLFAFTQGRKSDTILKSISALLPLSAQSQGLSGLFFYFKKMNPDLVHM